MKAKAKRKPAPAVKRTRRLLPALAGLDADVLARATLNGAKVDIALVEAIVSIGRDLAIDKANVLRLALHDPDAEIFRSDLLAGQIDLNLAAGGRWRMDRSRDIGSVAVDGDTTTLELWCIASAALRGQTKTMRRATSTTSFGAFVRYLAREVSADVDLRVVCPDPGQAIPQETTATSSKGTKTTPPGFGGGAAARLTIKGARASTEQLRNAAQVLQIAREKNAPAKATKALVAACIVESLFRNMSGGDRDSKGILQLRTGIWGEANARSIDRSVEMFLTKGFTGKGGAIALARKNPGWSAGRIAQAVQGSAYPSRYDQYGQEADRIIAAWRGSGTAGAGGTQTAQLPSAWRRGTSDGAESSWTALDREARRLGRRRFVALPWAPEPRLVIASDQQLIQAQPHHTLRGLDDPLLSARPSIRLDGIKRATTVDLEVLKAPWLAPPGAVVEFIGAGLIDGPWEVAALADDTGAATARVQLQQPTTKVEAAPATSSAAKGTTTKAKATSSAPGRRNVTDPLTSLRGSPRGVIEEIVLPIARACGISVTAASVAAANARHGPTVNGTRSDHQGPPNVAWAADMSNGGSPTPQMDRLARTIARVFGIPWTGAGLVSVTRWGYRFQLIYRADDHYDHVHFGARRVR
ncbi:Peptidase M23B [Patulibacter medicamentivorans]|uniref:Peptidase M23B n=1 Tax=Patulibacter medicamentivorans TaxID=1097667 RepID=H0EA88_9ACTN|nr:Peptidase M23B [Patulibacter medicamentivorans]